MVRACLAKRILRAHSPSVAECLALKEGLEFSRACNLRAAWIESDAANVVHVVSEQNFDGVDGVLIQDIVNFMLDGGGRSCSHISREGNKAAHLLANHDFNSSDFVGTDVMPLICFGCYLCQFD
ncbi:hypothetical protein TIFTF001_017114 [Ficus carica]|uniref:RNase H type-1 domain-containing protein n=1 Tax=Ficus carica TaxID=3494 RepID=A0AA88ATZ8_FICCA|nr:hypothetical protein TIFTF001_017114 [Ficus carica]